MLAAEELWIVTLVVTILCFVGHMLNLLTHGGDLCLGSTQPTKALTPVLHKPHEVPSSRPV